jgi:hypothetical protein
MRTGRGEFLHKTYKDEASTKDQTLATERVLKQVRIVCKYVYSGQYRYSHP